MIIELYRRQEIIFEGAACKLCEIETAQLTNVELFSTFNIMLLYLQNLHYFFNFVKIG